MLQGEASQVNQGFSISDENYESAWQLLKDTYDNQMMIIETHLDEMLNFPAITKENKADSIRKFVWHIHTHIKSLETLQQPVSQWDTIILHLAKKKLDFAEQRDWQNLMKDKTPQEMPKLEEFLKFLTERSHSLRVLKQGKEKTTNVKSTVAKRDGKKVNLATTSENCKICEGAHSTYKCEELLKVSAPERMTLIRDKKLCINCLKSGHYASNCKSSTCKRCTGKHNTILHRDAEHSRKESDRLDVSATMHSQEKMSEEVQGSTTKEYKNTTISICHVQKKTSRVILSTTRVYVVDHHGNKYLCRALLDSRSQSNIITEDFLRRCNLRYKRDVRPISGINQAQTNSNKISKIRIESTQSRFNATIECLVLKTITEALPQRKIEVRKLHIPKDVQLADPKFDEPSDIDLLIGAGLYWKILLGTPRNSLKGQPALQNTKLGWIIGGEMYDHQDNSSETCLTVTNDMLRQQIERFWIQESIPEGASYTVEEETCEQYFAKTTTRDSTGRFQVRLPMKPEVILGDSKKLALRRLLSLERRFVRNPALKSEYVKFMDDYREQNHMSLVTKDCDNGTEEYLLPHQAVIRAESKTTKIRVVFDASAKTTFGTTPNEKLIAGPNLQRELIDIILRFRTHAYVLTADVAMMFRQILVDKRDRSYQRILWRKTPDENINTFELNTVTYGTSCAPYLAIRCLRQLAEENGADLPQAAKAVREDCYMDDVLTACNTMEDAIKLQKQLSELLKRGHFHLRKWRSNNSKILQHLEEQCKTELMLTLDKEEALKTLGLLWNAALDCLQYQARVDEDYALTKRAMSKVSQIFDPLGLVAPLLIKGKMIMQRLWEHDLDWDQVIPEELKTAWEDYCINLQRVHELRIPRRAIHGSASKFDIFGFGDASEKAYGACLYGISTDEKGNVHSHLIISKTKVSLLKRVTLPRLELEAALLLSRLYHIKLQKMPSVPGSTM